MFPLEGNGLRPYREDLNDSWHQAIPRPANLDHNSDRFKWGNLNALLEDQVQVVNFKHLTSGSKAEKRKNKRKLRLQGSFKLKRLGKPKTFGKPFGRSSTVPQFKNSSKGRRMCLKLEKRGIPGTHLHQNTKKKLKEAIRSVASSHI